MDEGTRDRDKTAVQSELPSCHFVLTKILVDVVQSASTQGFKLLLSHSPKYSKIATRVTLTRVFRGESKGLYSGDNMHRCGHHCPDSGLYRAGVLEGVRDFL